MEVSICFHWIGLSEALQETMVGLQHIVITTPEKKHRQKTYIDTQKTKKKKTAISISVSTPFFLVHIVSSSRLASSGSHGHPGRQFDETLPQGGGIAVEKRIGGIEVETDIGKPINTMSNNCGAKIGKGWWIVL